MMKRLFNHSSQRPTTRQLDDCVPFVLVQSASTVPDAPVIEPETEPLPQTSPPAPQTEPSPFEPDWPADRPEPQPKA